MFNIQQQKEVLNRVFILAKKEYLKNAEAQDEKENSKTEKALEQELNEI